MIKEKFNITIYDNFLYGSKSLDKFKKNKRINIIKGDTRDIHKLYIAKKNKYCNSFREYTDLQKISGSYYSVNLIQKYCNYKDLGINNYMFLLFGICL